MIQENSIEIVSVVLAAGESRLFALSGEYFEIIDANSPIDVVLSDFNGAQRARMNQASASFYSKGVQYGVIQITSAAAQTIRFAYGTGETGTRRANGSVTISGDVALDAPTLAALESTDLNAATINQLNRPQTITGSYANSASLVAGTTTVFSPGTNTNGVILLAAGVSGYNSAGATIVTLVAKSGAAPTNITDGDVLLAHSNLSAGNINVSQLNQSQFIEAGKGLYIVNNVPDSGWSPPKFARWRTL